MKRPTNWLFRGGPINALLLIVMLLAHATPVYAQNIDTVARGLAASKAAVPSAPTLGACGNSWVSRGVSGNNLPAKAPLNIAAALLKDRVTVNPAYSVGYSGQTSSYILANLAACLTSGAKYQWHEDFINDQTGGLTVAVSIANLKAIYQASFAANVVPIFETVPPRGDASNTATLRGYNAQINDAMWALYYSSPRGSMYVVDAASALTSRASSTGGPISPAYDTDAVHTIDAGGWLVGVAIYNVLNPVLPPASPTSTWRTSIFDRTLNPTGWAAGNPSMFGSAGTLTSGATGTLASNFTWTRTSGSQLTAALSKVTGVNGGEYQQAVISCGAVGASAEQLEMSYNTSATLQAGDVIRSIADTSGTGLASIKAVYTYMSGVSLGTYLGLNNSGVTGDVMPASFDRMPRTFAVTMPATEAVTYKLVIVADCSAAAAAGTLTIKTAGLKVGG